VFNRFAVQAPILVLAQLSGLAHGIGFGERADIEHDGSLFLWCDTNKDAPSAAQVQVMRQNNCGSEPAREGGMSVNEGVE
jgi:hypothetical protein